MKTAHGAETTGRCCIADLMSHKPSLPDRSVNFLFVAGNSGGLVNEIVGMVVQRSINKGVAISGGVFSCSTVKSQSLCMLCASTGGVLAMSAFAV